MNGDERAIRVMIVDDEYMVLNMLREDVPWRDLGMELVAEATNGKQALEKCAIYCPDLVLIDISMPGPSGLDTIRTAKTDFPAVRFAILTAHQDFGYAQQALHLGALAYVLKTPVPLEDMKRMLLDCRRTILAEREADSRLRMADQLLSRHAWEIRQSMMQNYRRGGHIPEQDWNYLLGDGSLAGIGGNAGALVPHPERSPTQGHALQAMHVHVLQLNRMLSRYPDSDVSLIKFSIYQSVREVVAECGGGIALPDPSGSVYAVRTVPASGSRTQADADVHRIHSRLQRFFRHYFTVEIAIGISSVAEGRDKLPGLLKEAALASSLAFYRSNASLFYAHEAKALDRRMIGWPDAEEAISAKWRSQLAESRLEGLRILKAYVAETQPEPALLKSKALAALRKADVPLERLDWSGMNDNGSQAEWYERVEELLLRHLDRPVAGSAGSELHEDIGKAIEYMQRNLHDNLTLAKVAERIHMNPSYFSHLFKLNTGQTFIDFLTKLRMERAKQLLLAEDLKSQLLCERIGFSSYPHFCTQFKKITGMTPSEYKQQARAKPPRPVSDSG